MKGKPEGGVEAFGLLRKGPGKGAEIAPPPRPGALRGILGGAPPNRIPVFRAGPVLDAPDPTPGVAESHGFPHLQGSRAGPAPGFPRRLSRPPGDLAPTQPRSPPPRACSRSPRPSPAAAAGARACRSSGEGAGDSWAGWGPKNGRRERWERGGARREHGRGPGCERGPSPRRRPSVCWPGRGAEREGRAPGAGRHGREPEAAAAAVGPSGGEARGPRPLTPRAARLAPEPPWGP